MTSDLILQAGGHWKESRAEEGIKNANVGASAKQSRLQTLTLTSYPAMVTTQLPHPPTIQPGRHYYLHLTAEETEDHPSHGQLLQGHSARKSQSQDLSPGLSDFMVPAFPTTSAAGLRST